MDNLRPLVYHRPYTLPIVMVQTYQQVPQRTPLRTTSPMTAMAMKSALALNAQLVSERK
jgi:hypothetical protein